MSRGGKNPYVLMDPEEDVESILPPPRPAYSASSRATPTRPTPPSQTVPESEDTTPDRLSTHSADGDMPKRNPFQRSASMDVNTPQGRGKWGGDVTVDMGIGSEGIHLKPLNHGKGEGPVRSILHEEELSDAWPLESIDPLADPEEILLAEHNAVEGSSGRPGIRRRGQTGEGDEDDMYGGMDQGDDGDESGAFDLQKLGSGRMDGIAEHIRDERVRWVYLLIEDPSSSPMALYTAVAVAVMILFGAFITVIETIPILRSEETNIWWFGIDTTVIFAFTIELSLRLFAHSDTLQHLKKFALSPLTIIDIVVIVIYYINWGMGHETTYVFRLCILRLFRLFRVFRAYKYSSLIQLSIEVMILALKRSVDALSALFLFMAMTIIIFSTLLYFAERGVWDEAKKSFVTADGFPSAFDSIPASFWFVITTITTVGYGDMVPTTFVGKLIAFPAMIVGILIIALPSIIVGRNFTIVWEQMRRRRLPGQTGLARDVTVVGVEGRRSMDTLHYGGGMGDPYGITRLPTSPIHEEGELGGMEAQMLSQSLPQVGRSTGRASLSALLDQQAQLMQQMRLLSQMCEANQTALTDLTGTLRARGKREGKMREETFS